MVTSTERAEAREPELPRIRKAAEAGEGLIALDAQILAQQYSFLREWAAGVSRDRKAWKTAIAGMLPTLDGEDLPPDMARRWFLALHRGMQDRARRLYATRDVLEDLVHEAAKLDPPPEWRKKFRAYKGGWAGSKPGGRCPGCASADRMFFGMERTTDGKTETAGFCTNDWHATQEDTDGRP